MRKPSEKYFLINLLRSEQNPRTYRGILGGRVAVEGQRDLTRVRVRKKLNIEVGIRNKMLALFSLGTEQIADLSPLPPGTPAKSDMCMF